MLKKMVSLLFCAVMLISMVACNPGAENPVNTGSQGGTNVVSGTDVSTSSGDTSTVDSVTDTDTSFMSSSSLSSSATDSDVASTDSDNKDSSSNSENSSTNTTTNTSTGSTNIATNTSTGSTNTSTNTSTGSTSTSTNTSTGSTNTSTNTSTGSTNTSTNTSTGSTNTSTNTSTGSTNTTTNTSTGSTNTSTNTSTGSTNTTTNTSTASTNTSTNTSSTSTNVSSNTSSGSSSVNSSTSSNVSTQDPVNVPIYDPSIEHKVVVTDVGGYVMVLDLNKCKSSTFVDFSESSCAIWKCRVGSGAVSGVKFRYSEYYDKDVVLVTSSGGWAKVIDYETQQTLWSVNGIHNAHSIEMLPNGDIVIAASGTWTTGSDSYADGGLHYFPAGSTTRSSFVSLPFAHAILWDPDAEHLWSVGFEGVVAIGVKNAGTRTARIFKIAGKGVVRSGFTGHDMVPATGMDGMYWVSDNNSVWLFDSANNTLKRNTSNDNIVYTASEVKGMAYFSDGTMVLTVAGLGNPSQSYGTKCLRLVTVNESSGAVPYVQKTKDVYFGQWEFYKVHTFTKSYQ